MKLKADIKFDPEKLQAEFARLEADYKRNLYNNIKDGKRYGWALLSRTGKLNDIHGRRYRKYKAETEFNIPTKGYRGYFAEVLDELSGILGNIFRARIIGIEGYREIAKHHDGHDGTRFMRYHIPIIPNTECTFHSDGTDFVMDECGGLYLFPGWEIHSVVNNTGRRVHLMFSAYRDIREMKAADIGTIQGVTDPNTVVLA